MNKIAENKTSNLGNLTCFFMISFGIFIYVLDLISLWNGYPFQTLVIGWKIITLVCSITFFVLFIINHFKIINLESKFLLFSLWIFIIISGIAMGNIISLFHFSFSILVFITFKNLTKNKEDFIKIIFVLTFIDFFGWALIKQGLILINITSPGIFSRLMIPLWLYYILIFCQEKSDSNFINFFLVFLIILNVFMIADAAQLTIINKTDNLDNSWLFLVKNSFKNVFKYITEKLFLDIKNLYIDFRCITTGICPEKVESPKGITLKEVNSENRVFYTGEKVYVTSELEANTLEIPILINVICYTEFKNEEGNKTTKYGKINGKEEIVNYKVIDSSQHTLTCSFDELPKGHFNIKFNASFDFSSQVKQKIYLMDRERLTNDKKGLKAKGEDHSSENVLIELYDIKDTNPNSIYTSGPVLLGINTDNLPIDISKEEIRESQFSLLIENNWINSGRISEIKNIYLIIPNDFSFEYCGLEIISTEEEKEIGYNTFRINKDELQSDFEDIFRLTCIMGIPSKSLDPTPVTTKYIKSKINYNYLMQETIKIEVK